MHRKPGKPCPRCGYNGNKPRMHIRLLSVQGSPDVKGYLEVVYEPKKEATNAPQ